MRVLTAQSADAGALSEVVTARVWHSAGRAGRI